MQDRVLAITFWMVCLIATTSAELISVSSWLLLGNSVLTPVPDVWRDITPVVEEALPKEAPLLGELPDDEEEEEEEDEELWLVDVVVDDVTIAVLTGNDTICPFALKVKVCS